MSCIARNKLNFNREWKFVYGELDSDKTYNENEWFDIGLPHSFGTPYFMENQFYVGYGCYRKELEMNEDWLNKIVTLEFDGVFQHMELYVNGQLCGSHKGGYTAFSIPITDKLVVGKNIIFIKVNNLWNAKLAPRSGEHVFNGGIYRDVHLVVTNPVHIAWYGTYVTTPVVAKENSQVQMQTEIVNESDCTKTITLKSTILFDDKQLFQSLTEKIINPNSNIFIDDNANLTDVSLWHPDTPRLYTLCSEIICDGETIDTYSTNFGIRKINFDKDNGFSLNDAPYDIIGANVHQDHAGWSDGVTRAGIERDINLIKDCGMNFIRGSHYPHHVHFAETCDKVGVLYMSELCFWGTGARFAEGYWFASGYPINQEDEKGFEESCATTLTEMIRINRNRPSIISWSVGNEVFFSYKSVLPKAKELTKRLVAISHQLDSSRPVTVGGAQRGGLDELGDIAGYNGDGASLYIEPDFPSMVTEYGSFISDRPGVFKPHYTDNVDTQYKWRAGKALWCGFHHGSTITNMGHMGMIDYFRLPLKTWYWYRKELLGIEPPKDIEKGNPYKMELKTDKHIIKTDGTDDAMLTVSILDKDNNRVDCTCDVLLEVVEGNAVFPTGKSILLSTNIGSMLEGLGAIELRSFYGGDIVIKASSQGLLFDSITIKAEGELLEQGRQLRLTQGPPSLMEHVVAKGRYNIGKNRPVFASSFQKGFEAYHISKEDSLLPWKAKELENQWVMIDLEGTREIETIKIFFSDKEKGSFKVLCSQDANTFMELVSFDKDDDFYEIEPEISSFRYLRIEFKVAMPVQLVELFEE